MRVYPALAAMLVCSALSVAADTEGPALEPLSAEAFEAYTTGKTLTYATRGASTPYGVEEYLPGRRVVWSFVGGEC